MSRIGKWTDPLLGPSPHLAGWPAEHRYELLVVEVDRAPYRFAPFERPLRRLARLREYIIMVGGDGVARRSRHSARARGGRSTKETREARDERRETRGEKRGTRDERRRARDERRETKGETRETRDERRETRDERRENPPWNISLGPDDIDARWHVSSIASHGAQSHMTYPPRTEP